jgi:peroxiredoxin
MPTKRRRAIAACAGVVIGLAIVGGALALTRDGDNVDGTFVLDEPGVYSEPVATVDQSGRQLPDVQLTTAAGETVGLRSMLGRPLVINIWYSTCAPCAKELRDFAEVSREVGDSVQFVGVDPVDDAEKMEEFAGARGVDYPLLMDRAGDLLTKAGVAAFPTTLFVSSEGVIVHQSGAIQADDLRRAITDHLT